MFGSGDTNFGSGETEVHGMWVLSPGETPNARKVGVQFGRKTDIPRTKGFNVIIIGLLLYMNGLSANSQGVLSRL